ncbi:hypothetical protein CHUAL_007614 [Chamberlinius hualienensis]
MDRDMDQLIHRKVVNKYITELSITWEYSWLRMLSDNRSEYLKHLTFAHLKKLEINVCQLSQRNNLLDITSHVLKYCSQLEWLKLTGISLGIETDKDVSKIAKYKNLLPKLLDLHLQFDCFKFAEKTAGEWLRVLFNNRQTKLNEIHLGNLSYTFLENNEEVANLIFACWRLEKASSICLAVPNCGCKVSEDASGKPILPALPRIWQKRKALKCRRLTLQNFNLEHVNDNSAMMLDIGSRLQALSFNNCKVVISDMAKMLEKIAENCKNISELDVTLDHRKCIGSHIDDDKLAMAMAKFKALKKLRVSSYMFSFPRLDNSRHRTELEEEISEESMKNTRMWMLTQNCKKLESLSIEDDKQDRLISENTMSCISKFKNLNDLNLKIIRTTGRGDFLSYILKSCKKLRSLYLNFDKDFKHSEYVKSIFDALDHAISIKQLCIKQQFKMCNELCFGLGQCVSLEKIYLNSVKINPRHCDCFTYSLTKLPKLNDVLIVTNGYYSDVLKSMFNESAERFQIIKRTFEQKIVPEDDDFGVELGEKLWWGGISSKSPELSCSLTSCC